MADYVLLDGDQALFLPTFGASIVAVQPGVLTASGPATVGNKKLCIEGDEASVSVPGCAYMTPQYLIPGVGTLEIDALAGDQTATKTSTGGTAVLLVGGAFTAKLTVSSPAMQPPPGPGPPIPDSTTEYSGRGQFVTTNTKLRGV
jgi:Contractile injection system spike tip protein